MLRRMAAVPTSATDPAASNGDRVLIDTFDDPLAMFQHYFQQAQATEPFDPTALALATADAEGRPAKPRKTVAFSPAVPPCRLIF